MNILSFFKKLFRIKSKRVQYVYMILYFDPWTMKMHHIKQISTRRLEQDYPNIYGGTINRLNLLFIYEDEVENNDEQFE